MDIFRKIIGFPFSLIWWLVSAIRNQLYASGVFTSQPFDLPVIGVGNLSMGGSGKTPHVEYLIQLLHDASPTAVLSRGYKRRTSGYIFASTQSTVKQIGDEPLQYKLKYPSVPVAVCESRVMGIPQLLMDAPDTEVILLDDVFQHRAVKPGLNILLTDYNHPFTSDMIFPAGNLRESPSGAQRADIIIVTKCPANLSEEKAEQLLKKIKPKVHQKLFFTTYHYGQPYSIYNPEDKVVNTDQEILIVTGIAKPEYFKQYVSEVYRSAYLNRYADHYQFELRDLNQVQEIFKNLGNVPKSVFVSEKDAVKLVKFRKEMQEMDLPVFIQPIQVEVLFGQGQELNKEVVNFVENFYNG